MQTSIKQKALAYFQKGKFKKAQELYSKAYNQNRYDPESAYMLASCFANRKLYDLAIKHFESCLKLQPDAFVALYGLANSYQKSGQYELALEFFGKALKQQPRNPEIISQVAAIFFMHGKYDEAENIAKSALESHPKHPELLHLVGEAYFRREDIDNAYIYYDMALKQQPRRANTLYRIGTILSINGKFDKAIDHFKSSITLEPKSLNVHCKLAMAYTAIGKLDLAMKSIDRILTIHPDSVDALITKSFIYEKIGDIEKTRALISALLDKDVIHNDLASLYLLISNKIGHFKEAVSYANKVLEHTNSSGRKATSLLFSAGKACDSAHEYEKAFSYYKRANDTCPDKFDPINFNAHLDSVRDVFNWSFINHPIATGTNDPLPVMIVGMPRSGTSLTEQILASHPDIYGAGELLDMREITNDLSNRIDASLGYPNALKKINAELLHEYSEKYLDKLRNLSSGQEFVTDKMPHNFIRLGLISIMLPGAKIIHCMRNPIDTCLSIYFQNFSDSYYYATRLENIAEYYVGYIQMMEYWKSVINIPITEIKYRDLVSYPENKIRSLLDFVGVEWNDACLDFHKSTRYVPTASYNQVTEPMYTDSVDRWKHYETNLAPLFDKFSQLDFNPYEYA